VNVRGLLGRTVAFACLATLLGGYVAAAPALAKEVISDQPVKYYVVGSPVNGQREYLFAIAEKTLGNGRRHPEIFDLNKGRRQRDGRYVTDPRILEPGWTLLLPPDAHGPDVLVGSLSELTVPEPSPPPAPAGSAASASKVPGDALMRAIALTATVVLLGLALRLLRRGTRPKRRRPAQGAHPPRAAPVSPTPLDAGTDPPDPVPPAHLAPERVAPERVAPERVAPERDLPEWAAAARRSEPRDQVPEPEPVPEPAATASAAALRPAASRPR
jgi:hypothetical protein